MKSNSKIFLAMTAGLLVFQGVAAAEMVTGQVTAVNPDDRSLTIQRAQATGEQEEIKLKVPENAELRGIQSFEEVEVGDDVRAEANKPALGIGNWEAQWLERSAEGAGADAGQISQSAGTMGSEAGTSAIPGSQGAGSVQGASQGQTY